MGTSLTKDSHPNKKAGQILLLLAFLDLIILFIGHQRATTFIEKEVQFLKILPPEYTHILGFITSYHKTSHGIYFFHLFTDSGEKSLMVMPSFGPLPESITNDPFGPIEVITPKSALGENTLEPVSIKHIAKSESRASPFLPSKVSEISKRAPGDLIQLKSYPLKIETFASATKRVHLRLQLIDETGIAHGIMWDGTYSQEDLVLLAAGQPLLFYGEVGERYDSRPTMIVHRIDPLADPSFAAAMDLTIGCAMKKPQGSFVRLQVKGSEVNTFTSSSNRAHLRFVVTDSTGEIGGVFWDGVYSPSHLKLLESGEEFTLFAEISSFQDEPSLIGWEAE